MALLENVADLWPLSTKTRCSKFISPWRVGGELLKGSSTGLLSDRTRTFGRERRGNVHPDSLRSSWP